MYASPLAYVLDARIERDGTIIVTFVDGRQVTASLERELFPATSTLASMTYAPQSRQMHFRTVRGHDVVVDLAQADDLAPLNGRPTIYLDQNHWSTLDHTIHQPDRVKDDRERQAAALVIELASNKKVILPMSSAHISETCKQVDPEPRYWRALTIAQLSAGWQLRDPLELRRFELRRALVLRYHDFCLIPPEAITLEPEAIHSGRKRSRKEAGADLHPELRWAIHTMQSIGGIIATMLDAEPTPVSPVPEWARGLQDFAAFLRSNPTGREMKRRRTHAKFIADLGSELPEEAYRARITPDQMSDWATNHSEADLVSMPALGLFREVLHEKLSDPNLRWEDNDLFDMMYLTAAAGYCDYVVAEREHVSHIRNGLKRLGRQVNVYPNLRSAVDQLRIDGRLG